MLQGHRRPILDCWPRSRRAISGYLARIDQVLTLNSTARVAATQQRKRKRILDTRSRDGSSGQKIWTRRSRQDRARSKRSTGHIGVFHFGETKDRSAHIAHFRQDRPIPRPDRTDPNARSTQDYYLLSEDFRTAKTPIPKTNRDRCDSRSRSRHRPRVTAATQDQDRRTPVRGVKISAPEANAQPNLSARSTSPKAVTKSSSQPNRRVHKVSTRLYSKARIGVPPP